jgi:hypothetical protein
MLPSAFRRVGNNVYRDFEQLFEFSGDDSGVEEGKERDFVLKEFQHRSTSETKLSKVLQKLWHPETRN